MNLSEETEASLDSLCEAINGVGETVKDSSFKVEHHFPSVANFMNLFPTLVGGEGSMIPKEMSDRIKGNLASVPPELYGYIAMCVIGHAGTKVPKIRSACKVVNALLAAYLTWKVGGRMGCSKTVRTITAAIIAGYSYNCSRLWYDLNDYDESCREKIFEVLDSYAEDEIDSFLAMS